MMNDLSWLGISKEALFKATKQPIRGFKRISTNSTENFQMPRRATKGSAGYDFFNNSGRDLYIEPKSSLIISTDISSYMLEDEVLKIYPRSSLGFKYNVRIKNSIPIIDADYCFPNEIKIALYNDSLEVVVIKAGQAFCQGIFQKYLLADGDEASEERTGGIGSTDK